MLNLKTWRFWGSPAQDIAHNLDWYLDHISLWAGGDLATIPRIGGQVDQSLFLQAGPSLHRWTWTFPEVWYCPDRVSEQLSFVGTVSKTVSLLHCFFSSC